MIGGTLDRLHLGDLLQWLQLGGLSGRLTLIRSHHERRLDFYKGRVVFVSSGVPNERLASWMAREQLLPAATLRRLLGHSMLRRALFTDLVLEHGGIDETSLCNSLTHLAETTISRVLLAPSLDFSFDPDYPIRDLLNLDLNVEPHSLLMEAARQSDESDDSSEHGNDRTLPSTGEAFERFFWELIREGVSGDELIDGQQVVDLHRLVGDIMKTLVQWLSSSPGLVPLPDRQAVEIERRTASGEGVKLSGMPHTAWNQMVLACSVRAESIKEAKTLDDLEEVAEELDLWTDMTEVESWRRPSAGRLDGLTPDVASAWSRSAAATAPFLDVAPDEAELAVHLLTVPTDFVLWVLTTLPVPHRRLRKTLLRELPRRLGAELARRADFPDTIRCLFECRRTTNLGAALYIARRILPSSEVWPVTVPTEHAALLHVGASDDFEKAAEAAKAVLED